ncbi:hypothetical protein FM110_00330 [Brachybacterium nesterenkovii]|uniref:Uncharacterized protein n=1 Tax=Brachybacterium nesterenkovii TaxID=47847 RepID=A0A1X6WSW9_9MICO|nr:hypothetical protein FM110_00330 [Brachybacterium nesterenkovii]
MTVRTDDDARPAAAGRASSCLGIVVSGHPGIRASGHPSRPGDAHR